MEKQKTTFKVFWVTLGIFMILGAPIARGQAVEGVTGEEAPAASAAETTEDTASTTTSGTAEPLVAPAPEPKKPTLPTAVTQIVIDPVDADDDDYVDFKPSSTLTAALKFLARGSESLAWTLSIEDGGLSGVALQASYSKVLTIVNSLFVLGLLGIAALFMIRPITRRPNMKRVFLVYAAAVVFVNFALPLNRLLIDGSQLLSRTMLYEDGRNLEITDIIKTAPSQDPSISLLNSSMVAYVKQEKIGTTDETETLKLKFVNENEDGTPVSLGQISRSGEDSGIFTGTLGSEDPLIRISLTAPSAPQDITLKANNPISAELSREGGFDANKERTFLSTFLIALNGMAYFLMAGLLVVRLVILWGLLILSPALFLLGIFEITRGYFMNWLSVYGRWLLIGPLMGLGLAIVVGLWKTVGIPLKSTDLSLLSLQADPIFNVSFRLPGSTTLNTLSTTNELMQYFTFIVMLYLPIFFAFALTHGKAWSVVNTLIERRRSNAPQVTVAPSQVTVNQAANTANITAGSATLKAGNIIGGFKDLFSSQVGKLTGTVIPGINIPSAPSASAERTPSAQNFLPEQLSLTSVPQMLKLMGTQEGSRASREAVITKLAAPHLLSSTVEQKNATLVRQEIMNRAAQGMPEAIVLKNEIQSKSETLRIEKTTEKTSAPIKGSPINVNVRTEPATPKMEIATSKAESKPEELKEEPKPEEEKEETEEKTDEDPKDNPNPDEEIK